MIRKDLKASPSWNHLSKHFIATMLISFSLEASLFSIKSRTLFFDLSGWEREVFPIKEDKERSDLKLALQPHRSARMLKRATQHRRLHYCL